VVDSQVNFYYPKKIFVLMRLEEFKQEAELVTDNERYRIYDLRMERIVLSLTELKPTQATRGHSHEGVEEVYLFIQGQGKMQLGDEEFEVRGGDIVPIPDGVFHRVFNPTSRFLKFFCVFEKYER
jgi:mannose-6-phosphate isomerase-like protein (cupin superfamily)